MHWNGRASVYLRRSRSKGLSVNNVYNSLCFLCVLLFRTETETMHPLFAKADRLSGEVMLLELKAVQDVLPIHKAQLL